MANRDYPLANFRPYEESRNPYFEKIIAASQGPFKNTLLGDHDTEQFRGKWRERLGLAPETHLQLELGAYHGETSIQMAKANPGQGFLGLEWKYKQCYVAAKKAEDQRLKNIVFLRANMARLPLVVAPGELDRVLMLFPDPWSKSVHRKWRVLRPEFFQQIAYLLKPGSEFLIKTDHKDYAEYIEESWQPCGGFEKIEGAQIQNFWQQLPPTPFEKIFLRQGRSRDSFFTVSLKRNSKVVKLPDEMKEALGLHG